MDAHKAQILQDHAHDLNNAMTVIQTAAELLQLRSPRSEDDQIVQESWVEMFDAIERASAIAKQITSEAKRADD